MTKQIVNRDPSMLSEYRIPKALQGLSVSDLDQSYRSHMKKVQQGLQTDVMTSGSREERLTYVTHVLSASMFGRVLSAKDGQDRTVPDFNEKGQVELVGGSEGQERDRSLRRDQADALYDRIMGGSEPTDESEFSL